VRFQCLHQFQNNVVCAFRHCLLHCLCYITDRPRCTPFYPTQFVQRSTANTLAPSSTASCSLPPARQYNLHAKRAKHTVKASSHSFTFHFSSIVLICCFSCQLHRKQYNTRHWPCPQMDRKRANWDPATTRLFLDLVLLRRRNSTSQNRG
jgi:hypothetical protein